MRLLLDTNIIVDYLRAREPFDSSARMLLILGNLNELELWMSPSQFGDLTYILTKGGKHNLAPLVAEELKGVLECVHVCQCGQAEVAAALESGWPDLEDALLHEVAKSIRADAIITRNGADFSASRIPVYDCDALFAWYAQEHGISYAEMEV